MLNIDIFVTRIQVLSEENVNEKNSFHTSITQTSTFVTFVCVKIFHLSLFAYNIERDTEL